MHDGCKKGPQVEVIWADGRGRAWFCKPHFASWKKVPKDEIPREIVREKEVPDGTVGEKFGEYPKKKKGAKEGDLADFIARTNDIEGYDVSPDDARGALEAVEQGYPVSYATQDKHVLAQMRMLEALETTPRIDADAVRELHRTQGDAVLEQGAPGMWRSGGSRSSGGMAYAEPDQIPAAMAWWEKQEFDSPFQKIAVLMQIHPFEDGNGRMGRMALLKLNDMDVGKTMEEIGDGYFERLRSSVKDAGVDLDSPPWKQQGQEAKGDGAGEWEEFLRQHYEGGHKQVHNPNRDPGAKETVSVGYLVRHHPDSVEAQEIRRRFQAWRGVQGKTAKATGTKCGDGESVGLFIPLPKNLAKKFPSLGQEDTSPSHVTFLYIGDFKGNARQAELVDVLKDVCRRWWPVCKAVLGDVDYFDHHDKDRRVPHVCVDFDKDLSGFRQRVKQELTNAGIEVGDRFPEYKPHVTLAYMPGMDGEWKGKVPKGSWDFDKMEVWGLPKVHRLQLGPSIHKISEEWLHRCFVAEVGRLRVAAGTVKTAGWWAITPDNPGINSPPVDKGGLMNAIPGTDPADAAMYTGDGPADHTGQYLDQIDIIYRTTWGRPAKPEELAATFQFCFRPVADGSYGLNEWFDDFIGWLGVPATDITWSLEIWDQISWFFLQVKNQEFIMRSDSGHVGPKPPPLPHIWSTLDVVKDDLIRLNELEYPGDTATGRKFHEAVMAKFDTLRGYWMDAMFPKKMDDSERALVERISEKWRAA
jgi:2'-5' RNA ligase